MKLIVISSPSPVPNEHAIINSLFEEGLEIFHVHKPDFNKEEINDFIQQIPDKYQSRIFLHTDFPKFHSLEELTAHKGKYEYAFLSPIFDSISKVGYKSNFDFNELKNSPLLRRGVGGEAVIALGGIDEDKIEICREISFTGVAILGVIWNSKNPAEKFKKIKRLCHAEQSEASILDSSLRSE